MEKRIDTVIVDDDNPSIRVLAERLKGYPDVNLVATAGNGEEGWNTVMRYKPELLFLDVELSDTSGLEFLSSLDKHIDWNMKVVFYTSYEKYLLPALRLQAFDFLLKPVSDSELSLIMNRFYLSREEALRSGGQPVQPKPLSQPVQSILITTITNDKLIVRPENIGFFKYDSERKLWRVVLNSLQHFILKHQTTAETILNYAPEFIQIHKTYIININYLYLISENSCTLLPPFNKVSELKVSKMYKKKLLDRFSDMSPLPSNSRILFAYSLISRLSIPG